MVAMMRGSAIAAAAAAASLGLLAGCGGDDDEGAATTETATTETATTETVATEATTTETTGTAQGDAEAGKAVFASAGCGGCHTLEEAGSSGSVGPKLDGLNLSFDRVKEQVENGGGAMPAFKGQLTDQQINDVAAFVSQSSAS
jgi:mono/diheme cytochrome c family protein